jgi:hypothetical protein
MHERRDYRSKWWEKPGENEGKGEKELGQWVAREKWSGYGNIGIISTKHG